VLKHFPVITELAPQAARTLSKPGAAWLFVVAIVSALSEQSFAQSPKFTARPASVELGKPCKLIWQSSGQSGYLIGHGLVPATGSLEVTPSFSKTYILVVDRQGKTEFASAAVKVKGQRGGVEYPAIDKFTISSSESEKAVPYLSFLAVVEKAMHDTNGFEVEGEFKPSRPYVVLYTHFKEDTELRSRREAGRNKHRLAYCVFVYPPSASEPSLVRFDVKALVQTRPIAESEWNPTKDLEMVRACAEKMKTDIIAATQTKAK
jgi:hypothetical protein